MSFICSSLISIYALLVKTTNPIMNSHHKLVVLLDKWEMTTLLKMTSMASAYVALILVLSNRLVYNRFALLNLQNLISI